MKKIIYFPFKHFPFVENIYEKLMKRRYQYLYKIIKGKKCRKIMEIGTFDGKHALKMIKTAKKFHGERVEYFGFDLFEGMNKKILEKEIAKKPITKEETKNLLDTTGCKINLFKGFTEITLPQNIEKLPKMDLIFIDGGHSLETIKNDWYYSKKLMNKNTVVIFDDYWNRNNAGCKKIIENIDREKYKVKILPIQDWFPKKTGVLKINFVRVTRLSY